MIFGLVGIVLILKARLKEKINFSYALIAIFIPEILIAIIAALTGEWATLFQEPGGGIVTTDAMKISNSLIIMIFVFLVGAFVVLFTDIDNYNLIICILPLVAVLSNLFSIYRVVYYLYPISDVSNIQYYIFYLNQVFLKGSFLATVPLDLIFWLIDLGLLLVAILYVIRAYAHAEILEKKKILEMESMKKQPFNYPNIKPGEFDEIFMEELDDDEKDSS